MTDQTDRPISWAQIKKIHALKREMGMSERAYRQRLGRVGVKSCKELSFEQAKGFIKYFDQAAAKRSGRAQQRRGYGVQRISEKQLEMVRSLWREATDLGPGDDIEAALARLVERLYHVSALHWLPRRDVPKLVETLKAMKRQKVGKETMQAAQEALVGASAAPETAESAPIAAVND